MMRYIGCRGKRTVPLFGAMATIITVYLIYLHRRDRPPSAVNEKERLALNARAVPIKQSINLQRHKERVKDKILYKPDDDQHEDGGGGEAEIFKPRAPNPVHLDVLDERVVERETPASDTTPQTQVTVKVKVKEENKAGDAPPESQTRRAEEKKEPPLVKEENKAADAPPESQTRRAEEKKEPPLVRIRMEPNVPRAALNVTRIESIRDKIYAQSIKRKFIKNMRKREETDTRYANENPRTFMSKKDEVVNVILMPHSHNDPGWLYTFDGYFESMTKNALDNYVNFIHDVDPAMPFQWTESVSLHRWYSQNLEKEAKQLIQQAIRNESFLMDHGSWSMPDEASTTVYSLVENLMLGHQWLHAEFGVKPKYSWSNDPFGHSSTIPYLLKQSGIEAMVINRIDMLLKKKMRETQKLEFYWRQDTDGTDSTDDIFTHVLPHQLYFTAEAFGPDTKMAKKYDFSPSEGEYTPVFDIYTKEVIASESELKERAGQLAEQIHRRAEYFKHNSLLCPIGDDFRYISDGDEFTGVYYNWNTLRDYYNKHPEYKVKLQLGTLADFFRSVEEEREKKPMQFPVMTGDFFPYSDHSDRRPWNVPPTNHEETAVYWTGYFTTRPSIKVELRRLETLLRQTELLYSLTILTTLGSCAPVDKPLLTAARETLSWLLHHDAITGTSPVMTHKDFMLNLNEAVFKIEKFSIQVMQHLAGPSEREPRTEEIVLDTSPNILLNSDTGDHRLPAREALLISSNDERHFTLFNSLAHTSQTVVHIKLQVSAGETSFQLYDTSAERYVICQMNPMYSTHLHMSDDYLEMVFEATLPPLGMKTYKLTTRPDPKQRTCDFASIGIYINTEHAQAVQKFHVRAGFKTKPELKSKPISVVNKLNQMIVSPDNGSLLNLGLTADSENFKLTQMFGLYNPVPSHNLENDKEERVINTVTPGFDGFGPGDVEDGLYIFTTQGEGVPLENGQRNQPVVVVKGEVESAVITTLLHVTQCYRINNVQQGISITQLVDMNTNDLYGDLYMRFGSQISSQSKFYTDSNSFTMIERHRHYPDRPLASDYYPITSVTYLEDDKHRLTLLSGQPLGVTSLHSGQLEVMLDRRIDFHDHAGVNDPLTDNIPVVLQFRLLAETISKPTKPALTLSSLHQSLALSYPVSAYSGLHTPPQCSPINKLPCDYHLVNLRALDILPAGTEALAQNQKSVALILQRYSTIESKDELDPNICSHEGQVALNLPEGYIMEKSSLSILDMHGEIKAKDIHLKPSSIQSYRISPK